MILPVLISISLAFAGVCIVWVLLRSKNMQGWIVPYIRQWLAVRRIKPGIQGPIHVMFCFVDHFEPKWRKPEKDLERARVERWMRRYPELASRHTDADGCHPKHSFFYPEEEYEKEYLDSITALCANGYGEIEVHIHHDGDTRESLAELLSGFASRLHEDHAALPIDPRTDKPVWAFIHGNWALCNSGQDGANCGVNDEIDVLLETGCYVDMTMPSAPNVSQARTVNKIYYATTQDDGMPRSHDFGSEAQVGKIDQEGLMILPGPLGVSKHMRRHGVIPKIENGDVRTGLEPTPQRIDQWVNTHIHVAGRPEWVFVKVHTHGAQDRDEEVLLGEPAEAMHSYLESRYNDGDNYVLHYVSAREMFNIAKAAEAGCEGNPNDYRDYLLKPAPALRR